MILVALGANLPGTGGAAPLATCRAAAAALDTVPGLRVTALSGWWLTEPDPPDPHSPWYVNGIARCEGALAPEALLAALQRIEQAAGRQRPYPNAPRTLDLDIIAMGDAVRDGPDPILPHPRAHLRRFVLEPLAEVAPDWVHPRLKDTVGALLGRLPPAAMRRL
ncbi:2-amino-4-hydroxy-6-hydroxymethyldihydropteridine diphosphokinase [Teichococcus vastitatis]|uniref:2-amino-4-hydroxy-6-hydroxymethyldihydropteridine pyrophosphokinase n=1 Tax=Teichococcus vastitatis TaxID=2307076 RepID=A0ABS9W2G6_9PROT|nr:2-amino-4-hydroxy-6-hydroxymethyldihydropteridine diphosphokinase [Pseudoroseomonas vastitatis]MCI0753130.1 2-amino-4-hydroxy-6-hydroxymethyldihydropteridine diphosphokinase [Pseudoroseomonas vastitatis]